MLALLPYHSPAKCRSTFGNTALPHWPVICDLSEVIISHLDILHVADIVSFQQLSTLRFPFSHNRVVACFGILLLACKCRWGICGRSISEQIDVTAMRVICWMVIYAAVGTNVSAASDPADMLDKDKCLQLLAELRHAKWFQVMSCCCFSRSYAVTVILYFVHML